MIQTLKDFLLAGSPPHYLQALALVAYAAIEWVLPRTRMLAANSVVEMFANMLKPLLVKVPWVGWLVAKLATQDGSSLAQPPPMRTSSVLVLVLAGTMLSSCYCWDAAHVAEPRCIVAHQVVNCTTDAIKSAAPYIMAFFSNLIGSGTADIATIEQFAKTFGFDLVGCSLADLSNMFAKHPVKTGPASAYDIFHSWRDKYHPGNAYKLADGSVL